MTTKRRWMNWILEESLEHAIAMPWERGQRRDALKTRRKAA